MLKVSKVSKAPGPQGPAGFSSSSGSSCPNGNTIPTTAGGKYVYCADGTLVDTSTGLMWEEKGTRLRLRRCALLCKHLFVVDRYGGTLCAGRDIVYRFSRHVE